MIAVNRKYLFYRRPPPPNVPKVSQFKGQRKVVPNRKPLFPARRTSATKTPPKENKRMGGLVKPGGGLSPSMPIVAPVIPIPTGRTSRKSTAKKSE